MNQIKLFDSPDDSDVELSNPAEDEDKRIGLDSVCQVLVPYPVDKAYSYFIPPEIQVQPGDYVIVPLGNREVLGVVWDGEPDDNLSHAKIKEIITQYDVPPMPAAHRKFIDWVADYNMAPKGFVLKMSLSSPAALEPPKPITGYLAGAPLSDKAFQGLSEPRQRILNILKDGKARRASELAEIANCSPSVVKGMLNKHLVKTTHIYSQAPCRYPKPHDNDVKLSDAQKAAANHLADAVKTGTYEVSLLDGVTGAGKTEVYFEAVAEALKQEKQTVLLLPEIALSNAFIDRFKKRFGCKPALWHSALTPAQRRITWRGIATGETQLVVGARSALFLPYKDLGLIVVDEEHDTAYKQEDGVIYNARDMAIVRAHLGQFPIALISATPSLETITNAWAGRYTHLHLPDRFGGANMPDIHLVDMKASPPPDKQHFISPILKDAIEQTLEKDQQALLFLNRRGYAPLTLCKSCGHRIECPRCTAWLVEHRVSGKLHCHHCGYHTRKSKNCISCGEEDSMVACGPGIERIHEEVQEYFPDARSIVLASDSTQTNEELKDLLDKIKAHEYDIIIGTQIIAKGHHFPKLTCVGVIDSDLGLQGGDLRAAERTYQLLHQVSGRAGREALKGEVYLQTFFPDNKVMQAMANYDRDIFLEIEDNEREMAEMPPHSRLAGIIVSGKDENLVFDTAKALGKTAPNGEKIQTLGPAEAPFYRLRGNYRRRLLVRADKNINIQSAIKNWISGHKIPSTIRVYIDIDPQSFL